MKFSLVLCTVGRSVEIGEFFESLVRQNRSDYEVVLVDQNEDDRLAPIVAAYADKFPLRHVRSRERGLSRARNLGLKYVTGDIVGFPDDDCTYFDATLDRVAGLFDADETLGGITGYPVADKSAVAADWRAETMQLDRYSVLNRCQEFTIFLRRSALKSVRFNDGLGVGAGTPWGADEGPDFLIRVIENGARIVFYPHFYVYHPNKILTITPATLQRAASYARGRGALFRIHRFPKRDIVRGVGRPAAGAMLYLLRGHVGRSRYYAAIVRGQLAGLFMKKRDLDRLKASAAPATWLQNATAADEKIAPLHLPSLPERPLVSVLIANYNYARFLTACLDSLLAQSYDHWEAVVCDDGSTDNSADIVRGYAERDARIRLVEKPNGGQNTTVNECYRHLTGDVVCLLDSDDTFAPNKLRRVVATMHNRPQAGVVNHFCAVIDGDGRELDVTLNHRLDSGWLGESAFERGGCVYVPTTSCMSFRREVLDALMPMPAEQKRDADGYLGMAAQFLTPFAVIDDKLAGYRVHGHNMGGLTEPTPQRLAYELMLIGDRTRNLKAFVANRFGQAAAQRLVLEDNPQYLQAALKMHAMGDAAQRGSLVDARTLVAKHPSAKWRTLWGMILSLPGPLRRRVLPTLHRGHKLKAFVHRLTHRPAGAA